MGKKSRVNKKFKGIKKTRTAKAKPMPNNEKEQKRRTENEKPSTMHTRAQSNDRIRTQAITDTGIGHTSIALL